MHSIKKVFQNSVQLRGMMLDATVDIERSIDNYLADYFCYDAKRGNELREMLLHTERLTLGSKKDIYFMLLDRYHKDTLKKYSGFKNLIEQFIPHRNILAHLEVDYDQKYLKEEELQVVFKKYKNGKLSPVGYGKEDVQKLFDDLKNITSIMKEIKPPKSI